MKRLAVGVGVCLVAVGSTIVGARPQDLTRRDATAMEQKLIAIVTRALTPRASAPLDTSFTDRELNAYLKFNSAEQLPPGVVDPQVTIADTERVSGRAIVDLDAVRKSETRGWLDPLSYVTGSVEVRVAGRLHAANGLGVFTFESASAGGVPIPRSLFDELVAFYTKTPDTPNGVDLTRPFELPARIQAIRLRPGVATVVQ